MRKNIPLFISCSVFLFTYSKSLIALPFVAVIFGALVGLGAHTNLKNQSIPYSVTSDLVYSGSIAIANQAWDGVKVTMDSVTGYVTDNLEGIRDAAGMQMQIYRAGEQYDPWTNNREPMVDITSIEKRFHTKTGEEIPETDNSWSSWGSAKLREVMPVFMTCKSRVNGRFTYQVVNVDEGKNSEKVGDDLYYDAHESPMAAAVKVVDQKKMESSSFWLGLGHAFSAFLPF